MFKNINVFYHIFFWKRIPVFSPQNIDRLCSLRGLSLQHFSPDATQGKETNSIIAILKSFSMLEI